MIKSNHILLGVVLVICTSILGLIFYKANRITPDSLIARLSFVSESGEVSSLSKSGNELFAFEFGRTDDDIQSRKTYTFQLPENAKVVLMGVDAQSTQLVVTNGGVEKFTATLYDHTSVATFAADPLNFIQKNGHTVMIATGGVETDEVRMFRETLSIE